VDLLCEKEVADNRQKIKDNVSFKKICFCLFI